MLRVTQRAVNDHVTWQAYMGQTTAWLANIVDARTIPHRDESTLDEIHRKGAACNSAAFRIPRVTRSTDSLLSRLLARLAPIEPREAGAVVAAFGLFFCMWAGYFAVRPVRETIGTMLGREQVANLWIATWIGALSIIPLYGAIVARFQRRIFLPWSYGVVALVLAGVGFALREPQIDPLVGRAF